MSVYRVANMGAIGDGNSQSVILGSLSAGFVEVPLSLSDIRYNLLIKRGGQLGMVWTINNRGRLFIQDPATFQNLTLDPGNFIFGFGPIAGIDTQYTRDSAGVWGVQNAHAYLANPDNGQRLTIQSRAELTAIANGILTQASTITIPTNAVVLAASSRVVTQPGGTLAYTLNGTTSTTQFSTGVSVSTAAGTTDPGTKNCPFYDAQTNETVTYTFNAPTNNALGQIRTTVYYYLSTPPTS